MSNTYRYQLERYRGRSTRHVRPQCHRKGTFTRYIDTYNNNIYISENVGKCNRIDKCGYHYTPKQYYTDNPWKRDDGCCRSVDRYRENDRPTVDKISIPRHIDTIPEWVFDYSRGHALVPDHVQWLIACYGIERAQEVFNLYDIGATKDGHTIFWQRDSEGRLRTGKIMAYDATSGHRIKGAGSISWVHSELKRVGKLAEAWTLTQCLYGEHLLKDNPTMPVALVEAYKTAHVGAIVMPEYLWLATDSLSGLTAERLAPLKGRMVLLFPDEGKGYEEWMAKIADISGAVGFDYEISSFVETEGRSGMGEDIADMVEAMRVEEAPF